MTQTLSERFPGQMLPVKVIRLTQDQVAIIDPEVAPLISEYAWSARKSGNAYYAVTTIPHPDGIGHYRPNRKRELRQKPLGMHTLITGFTVTDHISGDGLDNRRCNLRDGSSGRNQRNRRIAINNRSGHTGVCEIKSTGKWVSYICYQNRRVYLGLYTDFNDAVAARHSAADKYFGVFAPRCCDARKGVA